MASKRVVGADANADAMSIEPWYRHVLEPLTMDPACHHLARTGVDPIASHRFSRLGSRSSPRDRISMEPRFRVGHVLNPWSDMDP